MALRILRPRMPIDPRVVRLKTTQKSELGRAIYANTIMLGALTSAASDFLNKENMLATMLKIIPKFKEDNKKAFELGYGMLG